MYSPNWRVHIFLGVLQWKGFGHLGRLWKRHAALVPTPWLHFWPLSPPLFRPQKRLAQQATPDTVNTAEQLARPAAVPGS